MPEKNEAIARAYSDGLQTRPMTDETKQNGALVETYQKGLEQLGFCMKQTGSRGNRRASESDWVSLDSRMREADHQMRTLGGVQLI